MGSRALIALAALAGVGLAIAGVIAPPAHPLAVLAIGALTVGLGLHGLGRVAGWLVADHDAPIGLAIAWGLAIYVAVGGAVAAFGGFDRRAQLALVLVGVGLGAIWIVRRDVELAIRARAWRPRVETLVTIAAAVLIAVHTIGAAGLHHGGFVDADGDLLGPLARLAQTGALPGDHRLGGTVVATSLGGVLGDWRASHAVDGGLGLALAVVLALGLRGPGALRRYLGVAIVALALAVPAFAPDLAPRWITVALVLATHASVARRRAAPLAVITAAALAAISPGGLGVVVVVVLAGPGRARRAAVALVALAGTVAAAPAPFPASVAPRLALGLAAGAVVWALLSTLARDRSERICYAATAAAVTAALTLSTPLAAAPFVVAALLVTLVVGLEAPLAPRSLAVGFAIVLALGGLRFRLGQPPRSWGDHEADVIDRARGYLGHGPDTGARATYRAAQAAIPAGAIVGLWVDRADLIDYRRHAVVDLRTTPRRRFDYLLISPSAPRPADPIAARAATGRTLTTAGDLIVVELRP